MKRTLLLLIFGGYGWLLITTLSPELPSPAHPLILYSNQLRDDLKLVVLRAIKRARHSIHLQIYGLSDPDVSAALIRAANRGIEVRLFYDPKGSPRHPLGHPVKAGGLMHRKICVIDETLTLIGTANFTTSSLKMHQNILIGLYHPKAARYFSSAKEQSAEFDLQTRRLKSFFLPDPEGIALEALITWIDAATSQIQIALFTFTHPDIIEALKRSIKRGVAVKIALDRHCAKGASKRAMEELKDAGAEISISQGEGLLHHKWALIDGTQLIVGSANWTRAAFEKNQDILLFLDQLQTQELRKIERMWQAIAITSQKG